MAVEPEAIAANDMGVELADARRFAEAIPHYEKARRLAPDWHAPHMNLGIAYKHVADWARSMESSLRALDLDAEEAGTGAWWNVGIAATALGDWHRARAAWTNVGIRVPPGHGPIDMNIGITPIRVNCEESPEVVWCHRLDPARAIVESIPTPDSGRRYRDLVLHDGEPRGKRAYGDRLLSVFDELAVLERSTYRTWKIDVVAPSKADLDELFQALAKSSDAALEDWSASLEVICKACSEGVPHERHTEAPTAWKPERCIAVAAREPIVFGRIVDWTKSGPGRETSEPLLVLT